jgi:hypothetical protein
VDSLEKYAKKERNKLLELFFLFILSLCSFIYVYLLFYSCLFIYFIHVSSIMESLEKYAKKRQMNKVLEPFYLFLSDTDNPPETQAMCVCLLSSLLDNAEDVKGKIYFLNK